MRFGRFSDSYKEEEKYDAWDKSIELYEKNEYLPSFEQFLDYLSDENVGNLSYQKEDGRIDFEFFQGSKKIKGYANADKVKAESKIAVAEDLNIGFLRRLIELNFNLKYTRYALDQDDNLTMVFDSYMLDGSPYKLYYALKELSVNSDKQDDLLMEEFSNLSPIHMGHIRNVSEEQKAIKFKFLKAKIQEALDEVSTGKLNMSQYPGGISYLLLDAVYRMDYIIRPEGSTMECLEKMHRKYFLQDGNSAEFKNLEIIKELRKLQKREEEGFNKELYEVKSTFGITAPTSHERLASFIDGEIGNWKWYHDNKHVRVSQAIPGYIVGYCLFNYALPAPDKDLLHLYYLITESQFFADCGFTYDLVVKDQLNKAAILSEIDMIQDRHNKEFPKFKPNVRKLNFQSMSLFTFSFMHMLKDLDLTRIKV